MERNIVTQRLALAMAAALAVGLLATDAQARGGMGGGHFGGGLAGGGFHGGMMTGRSAFIPGGARMDGFGGGFHGDHHHVFIGCCLPSYGFEPQNGCC